MIRAVLFAALIAAPLPVMAQVPLGGSGEVATGAGTTIHPVKTTGDASNGDRSSLTGDPNRRICRKSAPTGTRIANAKVCKSAREWDEQRQAAKEELERHQRPDGSNAG